MIYEYDNMIFLTDESVPMTETTIKLDLRSHGSMRGEISPELDAEYDEKGDYEGQIYFNPEKILLYPLRTSSLSILAPDPLDWDLYVMMVPFTLSEPKAETSSYKEVRFFIDFSNKKSKEDGSDIRIVDLFPRNITSETVGQKGYTISEHGRFQPVDAESHANLGKQFHFDPLQPVIEAFDKGNYAYFRYTHRDEDGKVEPGMKSTWVILQIRRGVSVLKASIYYRLLLKRVTKGYLEDCNPVTPHQPLQLSLNNLRPFFLPEQTEVRVIEPGHPGFDVCLLCALAEEKDALISVLEHFFHAQVLEETSFVPQRRYCYTTIDGAQQRLSIQVGWLPGKGPEDTCIEVGHILAQFRPRFMGMTGICAADQRRSVQGDLIVAESAFSAEAGKMWEKQKFESRPRHWNVPSAVLQATHGFRDWHKLVQQVARPSEAETLTVRVHHGAMASSQAVRADDPFGNEHRSVNGALALDMEGSAFYHTLEGRNIPYLLVKGVSDYADPAKKDDAFRAYAATLSALYMIGFVRYWFATAR